MVSVLPLEALEHTVQGKCEEHSPRRVTSGNSLITLEAEVAKRMVVSHGEEIVKVEEGRRYGNCEPTKE